MSMHQLSPSDQNRLLQADPTAILDALSRLNSYRPSPWLRPNHPRPDGSLPRNAYNALVHSDIIELIASRVPLHVVDGWNYLGRAFSSLLSGDTHGSRHLAYYAELRAALSLLAGAGIGVFNRCNVIVEASGNVVRLDSIESTHEMCWAAIVHWASFKNNSLKRVLEPWNISGSSLYDALRVFFPGSLSSGAMAAELLGNCGFDLSYGANDRDARNLSSYQPTALQPIVTTPKADSEFIATIWSLLRPGSVDVEKHLLRIVLETQMRSLKETSLEERKGRYSDLSDQIRAHVSYQFLTREVDYIDHNLFSLVADKRTPAHPYSMIARASLLLQMATKRAELDMITAGLQPAIQLENWWLEFGANRGLWPVELVPSISSELWDDVSLALDDAGQITANSRFDWIQAMGPGAHRLCETERAGIWGLFR